MPGLGIGLYELGSTLNIGGRGGGGGPGGRRSLSTRESLVLTLAVRFSNTHFVPEVLSHRDFLLKLLSLEFKTSVKAQGIDQIQDLDYTYY